jgi:hypothetical protein
MNEQTPLPGSDPADDATGGKHRILSIDGGGIRGLIAVEVLSAIEALLRERYGKPDLVLADHFDMVAGTSTGAIIATAVALGLSCEQIRSFYLDSGAKMFEHAHFYERFKYKYKDDMLSEELRSVFGADTLLGSDRLRCVLMMIVRNSNADETWTLTNNPHSPYNAQVRGDRQLDLPLWQLVRASAAAPSFFPPEVVKVGGRELVFIDGSVSSYCNPAFQAVIHATAAPYGLNWKTGPGALELVSVGTGLAPHSRQNMRSENVNLVYDATVLPASLILSSVIEQDFLCRLFGVCHHGIPMDKNLGDMVGVPAPGGTKLFDYVRYNVELTGSGLDALGLADIEAQSVQMIDSVAHMGSLTRIGKALARRDVRAEHFR